MKAIVKDNKRKEHELHTLRQQLQQLEANHKVNINILLLFFLYIVFDASRLILKD